MVSGSSWESSSRSRPPGYRSCYFVDPGAWHRGHVVGRPSRGRNRLLCDLIAGRLGRWSMALRGDLASSLRSAVRYPWLRRTPRRPGWGYCVGIRIDLGNPSRMLGGTLGAQMNAHARHSLLATIVALILLVLPSVSARAQDFSSSTGVQLYKRFCSSCHGDQGRGDGTSCEEF